MNGLCLSQSQDDSSTPNQKSNKVDGSLLNIEDQLQIPTSAQIPVTSSTGEKKAEAENKENNDEKIFIPVPDKISSNVRKKSSAFEKSVVKRISREDIRLIYNMECILGTGNFGTVRLAHKASNPDRKFAVKSLPRKKVEVDLTLLE